MKKIKITDEQACILEENISDLCVSTGQTFARGQFKDLMREFKAPKVIQDGIIFRCEDVISSTQVVISEHPNRDNCEELVDTCQQFDRWLGKVFNVTRLSGKPYPKKKPYPWRVPIG